MTAPRVSIVTPSYNQAPFLRRCIESVVNGNTVSVEHIVVDGLSDDDTVGILEAERRPHLTWRHESDAGQTDALRKGLALAEGEFFGWLNVDEYYDPGVLDLVVDAFDRNPNAVAVYGDFRRVRPDGTLIRLNRQWKYDDMVGKIVTPIFQSCAVFFRTERVREVGGFDATHWDWAMDWDLYVRVMDGRQSAIKLDAVLGNFCMHGDSKTSRGYAEFKREVALMRESNFGNLSPRQIEWLRKWHYARMMTQMLRERVLWDKAMFKLFRQQKFEIEYGTPGTEWPILRHARKLSPYYWRHPEKARV